MDTHWANLNYHDQQQQNQQHLPIANFIPPYSSQNPPNSQSISPRSQILQKQLRNFWESQLQDSEQANEFRNHSLPLARIKKIMKSDEDVRMISAEAPVLLSRACEIFIQDLTLRSWISTEESKRRTLQKGDISAALSTTDLFDFLVDIVPREKPITPVPPMVPFMLGPSHQQPSEMRDDYAVAGDSVGLTMGLSMQQQQQQGQNDQVNHIQGSLTWLSQQSSWPPPDL